MDDARMARCATRGWRNRWRVAPVGGRSVIHAWHRLSSAEREAIEAEAMSLPLQGLHGPINVRWSRLLAARRPTPNLRTER
jgi:hypothetical protein